MKKMLLIFTVVLMIIPLLASCGESKKLLGTWQHERGDGDDMVFSSSSVWTVNHFKGFVREGTYSTKGDKITMIINGNVTTASFRFVGDTLVIDEFNDSPTRAWALIKVSSSQTPPLLDEVPPPAAPAP